jgi:hypothetical protein
VGEKRRAYSFIWRRYFPQLDLKHFDGFVYITLLVTVPLKNFDLISSFSALTLKMTVLILTSAEKLFCSN